MQSLLLAVITLFTLVFSSGAQTVQVPVTPGQMAFSNFVFAVATQSTNGGVAFHVTITSQNAVIGGDCAASLAIINGPAKQPAIEGVKPAIQVALARTGLVWQADFLLPTEALNRPEILFIFAVPDYATHADGTRTYLPSDRVYEIRLQDFLPN